MRRIAVIPADATDRVAQLLASAGWESDPVRGGTADPAAAVDLVRRGEPAIVVPDPGRPASRLRKILVVHEGSREGQASMDVADEAAVAAGAEIVVLYAPGAPPSKTSASLPFRIADHGTYDWNEWRDEFIRRFCRCSPGVRVTLRVSAGSPETLRNQVRDEGADLVIVGGPLVPAQSDSDLGHVVEAVLEGVAPVLIVPATGRDRSSMDAAELGQRRG
jgi:nucleotide-binding universal stress UspA family protein